MKILVDSMPEKIIECPYAVRIPNLRACHNPLEGQPTFACEMNQDLDVCKGVCECPVFMSYDEFKRETYERARYKQVMD